MSAPPLATDWDRYYQRPARAAGLTRRITQRCLLRAMRRFAPPRPAIAELGGADSCFFDAIYRALEPREYHVVDNNRLGIERFRRRTETLKSVYAHQQDVLRLALPERFDLVFSAGLVEHFDPAGTQRAVAAHFDLLRPGGIAIITFPTPTLLYRFARRAAEALGQWAFPDERPLQFAEVAQAAGRYGRLLYRRLVWPVVFTQYHGAWRKG
jgi:SAM-dependent methyltransferase